MVPTDGTTDRLTAAFVFATLLGWCDLSQLSIPILYSRTNSVRIQLPCNETNIAFIQQCENGRKYEGSLVLPTPLLEEGKGLDCHRVF